jgi:hypothetical protein
MVNTTASPTTRLFYSYCHKDSSHRESMETSLALLKGQGHLHQWSDAEILPGQSISSEIRKQMEESDIIAFLFSPDFLSSEECMKEWRYAKQLSDSGKNLFRIPIIVRPCAWKDVLLSDDVLALPNDGKPVSQFDDHDVAWQQVYEGIKKVVNTLRMTFSPREEFLEGIDRTDFMSQEHLKLQDLFVFLRMTYEDPLSNEKQLRDTTITTLAELLNNKYAVIHGQEKSGKTALARYIYLSLIEKAEPVLLVDPSQGRGRMNETLLRRTYETQFHGDYSSWVQQSKKTLIVEDLNPESRLPDFLEKAEEIFDRIIITTASDVYYSFFRDDTRFAEFLPMKIQPLSRVQQEGLIRKRLALSQTSTPITDGFVDQVENRVNSIMISEKLLPRFPFYLLSILQTYEAYMPTNLSVTSYGHCYQALIFANLILSGISKTDDDVNACFNFSEQLAFATYQHRNNVPDEDFDFSKFVDKYRSQFFIRESIINRLKSRPYGLINDTGNFRTDFMYYYFLGKFLAGNSRLGLPVINEMCINSHREANYLTLLFTIHHTTDNSIIEDLLLRTMDILGSVSPATLERDETRRFGEVITQLPEDIMSSKGVQQARTEERQRRDVIEEQQANIRDNGDEEPASADERLIDSESVNWIYKILKNNKIMGQVLRNRHGNLDKSTIEEIIQTIADSGLRLVNSVLANEQDIARLASYISQKHSDWDAEKLKEALRFLSFLWTMVNIEQVVEAFNIPEIREAIDSVVKKNATPAYDLIGYFSQLDSATQITGRERASLASLLKKHDDLFVQRVLSIRTQFYMNTHRSRTPIEQAICSLLEIRYRPRLLPFS